MRTIWDVFQAFRELLTLLVRHRELAMEMAKRELADRYAGQAFGLLWAVVHPLFMICLYIFIFAFVFKVRIGGTREMPLDYTAYLLSGLVAWMSIQEAMSKSCTAITANTALVKQVVFPLEILPVKGVLAAMLPQLVSLVALAVYVLLTHGGLYLTYLLLPIVMAMQLMTMTGIAYLLAPIGAHFRDIKDFTQLFATAGIYLTPIFYLPSWVPKLFAPLLYLNPFSYMVWCYQDTLYFGRVAHPWAWVAMAMISAASLALGYNVFRKLKPNLGNIL